MLYSDSPFYSHGGGPERAGQAPRHRWCGRGWVRLLDCGGWGYNGQTNDWVTEEIDLSQFAGQKVQIRFEYITDAAVNGEGFLLDDISVDAINFQSDFEADDGGWQAAGFARVENVLPQTYRLALIIKGDTTTVTQIPLNEDQTAEIPLSLNSGEEAILIVTGNTRFTRLPAAYEVEIK